MLTFTDCEITDPHSYHFMLYVIQSGGESAPVKIGYTQDAARLRGRLKSLQCGNPETLRVLVTVDGAGPQSERALHRALGRHRIRNEWYTFAPPLRALVAAIDADPRLNLIAWARETAAAEARAAAREAHGPRRRGARLRRKSRRAAEAAVERQLAAGMQVRYEDAPRP